MLSQHLETLGFLPWSPETPPNSRKLRPSKLYEQNNDSEPQPVSSTSSHESVNFRRAVSIQKSALLSALDLDFSGLVWHCGIQPRSSVTSSPRAQPESIIATQPLPESGPSLIPSPTPPVPQPLSQPVASLTPSLTLAVQGPTSLVPQPGPSFTPSPTSPDIQTLPQPEPSTTPITTSQP